jgi:hypothetical protein
MSGMDASVGMFTKTTGASGSTQDITTPGWAPEAVVLMTDHSVAAGTVGNSVQTASVGGGVGIGWSDMTNEASMSYADVHGPTSMVVKVNLSATRVLIKSENTPPTSQATADLSSLGTGFRLTWGVNDAVATDIAFMALRETPAAPPGGTPPTYYSYMVG